MLANLAPPVRVMPLVFAGLDRGWSFCKTRAKRAAGRPPFEPLDLLFTATLCYRHRLLYHVVPKAGCSSIKAILLAYDGFPRQKGTTITAQCNRLRRTRLVRASGALWYRGWRRFVFVRNPWDRLVSLWAEKVFRQSLPQIGDQVRLRNPYYAHPRFRDMEFPDFARFACEQGLLEDAHMAPQHLSVEKWSMNFVGRFETFAESCAELVRAFGLPEDSLAWFQVRRNTSPRGPYQDYYDDAARRLVARAYARDIELFDYRF